MGCVLFLGLEVMHVEYQRYLLPTIVVRCAPPVSNAGSCLFLCEKEKYIEVLNEI